MGPQGSLCQRCAVWRHHYVRRHWGANDEGAYSTRTFHNEDQSCRTTRAQVFRVDWRLHLVFLEHFPADVDHEGRVRRVRTYDCSQEMLLICLVSEPHLTFFFMRGLLQACVVQNRVLMFTVCEGLSYCFLFLSFVKKKKKKKKK